MRIPHKIPRSVRLAFSVLMGIGIAVLVLIHRVSAAETVLVQYRDTRLAFPLTELQTFAKGGEITPALKNFFETNEAKPEEVREWLTTKISPGFDVPLPREFVLIQINKTLGEELGREELSSLRIALDKAYADDSAFSVLEVMENYPKRNIRLSLNRLRQVYADIQLFVTRIEPVLKVADKILLELVCDCNTAPSALAPGSPSTGVEGDKRSDPVSSDSFSINTSAEDQDKYTEALAQLNSNFSLTTVQAAAPSPNLSLPSTSRDPAVYANKQLVFAFGPFRPSISIGELTTFAQTGQISAGWRTLLAIAKINQKDLQAALNKTVSVDFRFLDSTLTSLLGEYLLYQVGQIIETPSGDASVQALRSAFLLAAANDNKFSMLELMQRYPTQQLYVNGLRLARLGRTISRFRPSRGLSSIKLDIESWLVELQTSAAEAICTCTTDPSTTPAALAPPPVISPSARSRFLPPNWQPVEPHLEQRGVIKVVWLKGTPYEMGYQHGQMLHNEIASLGKQNINLVRLLGKGFGFGRLAAQRTYPNLIEECQGLVAATQDIGMTQDACMVAAYADVFQEMLGYTIPKELFWNGCSQFVAANDATTDGRLYHGSTVDSDGKPVDYVVNNPVVFVRQPNDGLPHVFVTYPGVVWPNSGMNVAGISLGLDTAHPNSSRELSLRGRSNVQIMAKILETATSFEEARMAMQTQPRVRANLIMIADGKSNQAGVFEFTGKSLAMRSLQENGVLYTTNHFVLPEMYEKQPLPVDPSSVSRFERFKQLMEPGQPNSHYGKIDEKVMARILRDRTNPYTQEASPLDTFDDDASPGGNGSMREAIYEPENLLFWVAAGKPPVPENPFKCFSMGEMLGLPNARTCPLPEM